MRKELDHYMGKTRKRGRVGENWRRAARSTKDVVKIARAFEALTVRGGRSRKARPSTGGAQQQVLE
jgi:hypothetical protein